MTTIEESRSRRFSFAARLVTETEPERHLRVSGDVELQKLGVVPQTVFLKERQPEVISTASRVLSSRRTSFDSHSRGPILLGSPRASRAVSMDHTSTAPFEDLRRRLAANANGSSSTLNLASVARDFRSPLSTQGATSPQSEVASLATASDRPDSPSESAVSTSHSLVRNSHRLQVGSVDGHKAAPAVGSSKLNAVGLVEASSRIRLDASPERSGRSTPLSVTGTARHPRYKLSSRSPLPVDGMSTFR